MFKKLRIHTFEAVEARIPSQLFALIQHQKIIILLFFYYRDLLEPSKNVDNVCVYMKLKRPNQLNTWRTLPCIRDRYRWMFMCERPFHHEQYYKYGNGEINILLSSFCVASVAL